jgi:hypothetical protein
MSNKKRITTALLKRIELRKATRTIIAALLKRIELGKTTKVIIAALLERIELVKATGREKPGTITGTIIAALLGRIELGKATRKVIAALLKRIELRGRINHKDKALILVITTVIIPTAKGKAIILKAKILGKFQRDNIIINPGVDSLRRVSQFPSMGWWGILLLRPFRLVPKNDIDNKRTRSFRHKMMGGAGTRANQITVVRNILQKRKAFGRNIILRGST